MNDTWARRAPLTGIVAALLAIAAVIIGGTDTPDFDASASEVADYWDDSAQIVSALLGSLAAVFVAFFAGTLRSRLRAAGSLASLALAGGALFALGVGLFGGLSFTLADLAGSDKQIDPGALQALNALNEDLFLPAVIGLCVFYVGSGLAMLSSGVLPRWWGWLTFALGVLTVLGPAGFIAFILSFPWMLVTAIMLMRSEDSVPGSAAGTPPPQRQHLG
jgi:hypothetical protein